MLEVQKGDEIQNNSFTGLGMQFPLLMYSIWKRLIYLVIANIYFFVRAWGSMRNQEFHKGVDGLKSLGTPDLREGTALFHAMAESKQNSADKNLNVTNINTKAGPPNRRTCFPPNSSFPYESKRSPFGRRHQF